MKRFNSFVGLATRFATASIDWSVVAAFLAVLPGWSWREQGRSMFMRFALI
jgi:hypothetical protein